VEYDDWQNSQRAQAIYVRAILNGIH
jgi:hypothetical protein